MKIIAFAGSNSKKSINKELVTYVAHLFEGHEIEVLDLNDFPLPIFGVDLEAEIGIPSIVTDFASKISSADFIVCSLAENNGSYNAAFKNLYDWVSRIPNRKVFDDKPLLLMATSPGGRGGQSVLSAASERFPRDGAQLLGCFSLPNFNENFNPTKGILDHTLLKELKQTLTEVNNQLKK
ncbi:NADPH-dependent FMN reductase [Putridiphycobacter roseus]|uniref:NADPH-dependent FMN reductase n=1 Tax=Putridiphycobacter roseus TaxID=2219161 RepID=A0A2W1NSU4_9FLAO|nr:NAD(P)H-dependent oxidoreductase [Putridiphycobacter roseus]PZE17748.1 NADPH-dependent FMN reductase [Putridiphycobacter roseus]